MRRLSICSSALLSAGMLLCSFFALAEDSELVAQAQTPAAPPAQPTPAPPARHAADGRQPGVIELMNQMEDLQSEINRLRGQLEVLSNGLENAQKRQRDMYLDLDTRMRRMEQNPSSAAPRVEPPPALSEAEARPKPAPAPELKPPAAAAAATTSPAASAASLPPATTQTVPPPTVPISPARPNPPV